MLQDLFFGVPVFGELPCETPTPKAIRNVTDLILNAVALGAILEIDEVIFASVLPKKMQAWSKGLGC